VGRITDGQGNPLDGVSVNWTSGTPAVATVATVDGSGRVTAQSVGQAWIHAEVGEVRDSVLALVEQIPFDVHLSPDTLSLQAGDSARLEALVLDEGGSEIPGAPLDWHASLPAIASVTAVAAVAATPG